MAMDDSNGGKASRILIRTPSPRGAPFLETLDVRKTLLITARSAGITVVVMALFSACSSPPSDSEEQDRYARDKRRTASAALQADEEARLARKASAKDGALLFVSATQNSCREFARKTAALTAESIVDRSEQSSFIPAELYPDDPFVAYIDGPTLADVKSQLTQLVGSVVELLRLHERIEPASIARIQRQPDEMARDRAAFKDAKLKTLDSIDKYCDSLRRAGAGVGALR
jgi:hypothetical protein